MKPFLRYAGSKYKQDLIWQRVKELYEPYRSSHTFVEPFCGGLGMTLRVDPDKAILNDSNQYLIDLYRSLCYDGFKQVLYRNNNDIYEAVKYRFNMHHKPSDFLWLNQCCFNGLYRENSSGLFNVPIGKNHKNVLLQPKPLNLPDIKSTLIRYSFNDFDYLKFLKNYNRGDDSVFIYADPPYDNGFAKYQKNDFTWQDQENLAYVLANLPHPIIASNLATDRIINLYSDYGFCIEIIPAKRSISSNGDRKQVNEILAYKRIKL